ncbi:aldo/keto reductase [Sphingomonas xinjiangensis]|uniref:D-threo-aldose 1-dehydrogenase n=1 Tax=Sphingomonas xinjiangensis TaxID=643568 RepID=A0A840YLM5_9SPHN|nr:aldo/keto reductase [Sphingomonas xinjiangensis]MBB5712268.1 D-threo-aldose 1-dehydrogenase [Sphingomonas xinjiangensis]
MSLERRPLGSSGLRIPALGFGAAPLGNLYRAIPDAEARDTLKAALHRGLEYVDTAPHYGLGLSERRVGDVVRGHQATISTKVGRILFPAPNANTGMERYGFRTPMPFDARFDYSHDGILRSHEASLQRLGLAQVDIVYIHDIGRLTHGDAHPHHWQQLTQGGGLRALRRLRDEGAVKAIGAGVNEVAICLDLLDQAPLDAILLAGRYTLLEQGALDTLFPRCEQTGTSIVIGGPYNSGILAGGAQPVRHYDYAPPPPAVLDKAEGIAAVCARHGVPLGAAALQFAMAHPLVASVIPGLASVKEVHETMDRTAQDIPADLWTELKQAGLLAPHAPTPVREVAA